MPTKISKEEAQDWLDKNKTKLKILKWGGGSSKKSLFLDISNGREFTKSFSYVKSSTLRFPDISFTSTKKEKLKKTQKTNLKKWGTKTPAENKEIKQKIIKTNISKYGFKSPVLNDSINKKRKDTWMKNFGVDHPFKNQDTKEKIRQTNIKKWGFEYFSQTEKFKKDFKEKSLKKWGVDNPAKNKKIKQKILNSKDLIKIDELTVSQWAKQKDTGSINSIYIAVRNSHHPKETQAQKYFAENKVLNFLKELGLQENVNFLHNKKLPEHKGFKREYKKPDFCFPDLKKIIEVEGDEIHGNPKKYGPQDLIGYKRNILAWQKWKIDKERDLIYKKYGYEVVSFWEEEILKDFEKVKLKIKSLIIKLEDF